jgi:predicted phage tail protein
MKDGHEVRKVGESRFPSDTRRHHLGPWLRALAGICLATTMIGGLATVAGGITAGAHAHSFALAPSEPCPLPSIGVSVRAAAPTFTLKAFPDDKQVRLTWQPSASGTSYVIYDWPAQDNSHVARVDTASGSDHVVNGLTNGTTYCFVIVRGRLPYVVSNTVSATPAAKPGAPTGLTATRGNAQVTLSWTAPASDGGSQVSGYNVFEGTTPDLSGSAPVTNVTGTAVTLAGLVNGTTYYFKVAAVNSAGQGLPSAEVQAVPATLPGVPTGLTATRGNAQVTLSWTAPASDGGSRVSGYLIYQGTSPGGENTTPVNGSLVTATSSTVTGLTNGTTYYFKVTAVNGVGEGRASSEVSAVPATVPGAPTGLTATRGNAQVILSWAAPALDGGSQVTGYDLYVGTTADLSGNAPVARVTGTVVTVTNLINGTRYYFRVAAVNRVGGGPASNEVSAVPLTVPGAPTGLTATPGNSRVTLSWAAPPDGGAAISGYLIFDGTRPGGENRTPVNGSLVTATSYTVTGLTNGTTYYFRVIAVNAAGEGPLSAEAPATLLRIVPTSPPPSTSTSGTPTSSTPTSSTPTSRTTTPTSGTPTPSVTPQTSAGTAVSPPAAPIGLTATPGDTQVHLSWTAAGLDGGSAISYKVYLASRPGVQESAAIGTTKSTDATVAGLSNGTTYYFMVAVVNATGNEGPLSAQVAAEPTGATPGSVVPVPSPGPPKWLIALLAAVAAMAVATALTLIARRGPLFRSRERARQARSREQMAMAQDVRAVPDTFRVDAVKIRDTGREPTHTVRLEPHPGITTTTIKEGRP